MLDRLLESDMRGAETRAFALDPEAAPGEAVVVARASLERQREFATGRACARRALAQLGLPATPLLAAPDRTVRWPAGIVGSITHTAGYCAAAVGRQARYRSIGLDAEVVAAVDDELEASVCLPAERRRLEHCTAAERAFLRTLIFSAKEAFYKCQYPLTGTWLEFHDVEIETGAGTFLATPRVVLDALGRRALCGRFGWEAGIIVTICALEAADDVRL